MWPMSCCVQHHRHVAVTAPVETCSVTVAVAVAHWLTAVGCCCTVRCEDSGDCVPHVQNVQHMWAMWTSTCDVAWEG